MLSKTKQIMKTRYIAPIVTLSLISIFWHTKMHSVSSSRLESDVSYKVEGRIEKRLNVLFVCVDDLGEDISPYNKLKDEKDPFYQEVYTPNLERLASDSLVLAQAYNQYPFCNPSRSSLLTGRRPDTTRVYTLETHFREVGGNFTTIPQYFKRNGYATFNIGKVFHEGLSTDDPISWSEPYNLFITDYYRRLVGGGTKAITKRERYKQPTVDDNTLEEAIQQMQRFSTKPDQPWFLAVGFRATHSPLAFPEEYLKYYPLHNITVPQNLYPPINIPPAAMSGTGWTYADPPAQVDCLSNEFTQAIQIVPLYCCVCARRTTVLLVIWMIYLESFLMNYNVLI